MGACGACGLPSGGATLIFPIGAMSVPIIESSVSDDMEVIMFVPELTSDSREIFTIGADFKDSGNNLLRKSWTLGKLITDLNSVGQIFFLLSFTNSCGDFDLPKRRKYSSGR